jgi:hypothetical protein
VSSSEPRFSQRKIVYVALATAFFAACQPVPRPFAPAPDDRHSAMLEQSDHGGIVVLPVAGVAEPIAHGMAAGMAKALRDRNVPAATGGGNRRSRFLQGWVTTQPASRGRVRIDLVWDLFDADGRVIGSKPVQREVVGYRWKGGDRTLFDELATTAAQAIAALVQEPAAAGAAPVPRPPLHVAAVTDAPGDGGIALRRAMTRALGGAGFRLLDAPVSGALVITGRVAVSPPRNGRQTAEIIWAVRRTDGTELGRLTQKNAVPAGSLDGAWGPTARAIADAAVGGVRDLLSRATP